MNLDSTNQPRRIAIYLRVSTQEQKVEGFSPEAQRKRLLAYVQENKSRNFVTKPEWIFEDTHTGSDLNRPELQRMLKMVKQGLFNGVLVWKIDRLSRSLKHLMGIFEDMEKHETSFLSLQENIDFTGPIGKLIFQMFGAIAQFERELIKDRTRMGKITSAEMGNFTGTQIPYGYRPVPNPGGKGKRLEIIPEEKKWVKQIYRWNIHEGMGFLQITRKLNEMKVPKGRFARIRSRNSKWTQRLVQDILTSPIYRGHYVANRKDEHGKILPVEDWTVVSVPACVSEFSHEQARQARLMRHNGPQKLKYLLSGKLVDMTLDNPKRFCGVKRFKGGYSYRRKQFKDENNVHHSLFEIPGRQIEEFVWDKICMALQEPKAFIDHFLSKDFNDPTKAEQLSEQLSELRRAKANIEMVEIARIEAAYERGLYDEDKLQKKLIAKNQEINQVDDKIMEIEDHLSMVSNATGEVEKLRKASAQLNYKLDNLSHDQKKTLCQMFVDRVEMYRDADKPRKEANVSADIYFRFNLCKTPVTPPKGCTKKPLVKAVKGGLKTKTPIHGGKGHSGYTLFGFKVHLKSDRSKVILEEIETLARLCPLAG